ncbi:hypothetical protein [Pseudarthrobacter sp. BIM B-2242]|uniref:hypothetical protein n=1 Tax=Pseudarthrobacter sp. BIM B-2242 TaxID=2772401 RepID=UPI00168A9B9E|nr:hypothetical protein [Pseudarthrobacter sp. BIM B-2242]QOD05735.1 hypothetical protein IDT60_22100 [Pseudarthrobacter sp. BIM B-2242]
MGNDWTRLLQEAARNGGPTALKEGLKLAGVKQGILIGGAAVGALWVSSEIKSTRDQIRERRREKAAAAAAGNNSVVVVDGADMAGDPDVEIQGKAP